MYPFYDCRASSETAIGVLADRYCLMFDDAVLQGEPDEVLS